MKRYFLDMFSGIGGFALGAEWAGLKFDGHYFSEVDDYAVSLYKKRFPNALPLGDITKIDYKSLPRGEWFVSGGFPCQPFSVMGVKKGEKDNKNLWPECGRMLRELHPRYALFENVRGLLFIELGSIFEKILFEISESGYDAEWQVISASDAGAPHLRERIWIICYPKK